MIQAAIFDVFGTLLRIGVPKNPYQRLFERAAKFGIVPSRDIRRQVMTCPLDLAATANLLCNGRPVFPIDDLEEDLQIEIESMCLYPDTTPALTSLERAGIPIGLCSNLASPYAAKVLELLPVRPDVVAWSFSCGSVKPDAAIFREIEYLLSMPPNALLMVGDRWRNDGEGAAAVGWHSRVIIRDGYAAGYGKIRNLCDVLPLFRTDASMPPVL